MPIRRPHSYMEFVYLCLSLELCVWESLCVRVSDEIEINYILKTQEEKEVEEENKQLVN